MRILVTGGAGFIGGNLTALLVRQGHDVVVLDDLSTGRRDNIDHLDVHFIEGTILDRGTVRRAVAGCDSVVHLGAIGSVPRSVARPMPSHEANTTGTVTVLEAAAEVGAYVAAASSSSVYGANPALPKRESLQCRPRSPYAVSKLATESYTIVWNTTYGLPTIAFRFFNVYGPLQPPRHDYAAAIPAFTDAALRGVPLPIHGDGRQTRDFTYVDDVVSVLSQAAVQQVSHTTPVNLAFGGRLSLLDVAAELERQLGQPLDREFLPSRPGDVSDTQADSTLLLSLFPHATQTPFAAGLSHTLAWMRTAVVTR